jgi:hypothetical protein
MEEVYLKIWKLAKPYYKKGRPMDIKHISWMMKETENICNTEKLDETILMPLVILHDVGYGISDKVYFDKNKKEAHMGAGSKLAKKILEELNYPIEKIKTICRLIKIHDYWIYKKYTLYKRNKILWTFNDLDFIWLVHPEGFKEVRKILGKSKEDMIKYVKKDIRHKKLGFSCKYTKYLYEKYLSNL